MHPTLIHIRALLDTAFKRLDNARADIDRYAEALRASEGQGNVQECLDVLTAATTRREAALHDSDCLAVVATLLEQDRQYSGAYLIAAERDAQRVKYSAGHDAEHDDGIMAYRAAELAIGSTIKVEVGEHDPDGWGLVTKHRGDRVRQLTIAGALIAAEIDRLLAAQSRDGMPGATKA